MHTMITGNYESTHACQEVMEVMRMLNICVALWCVLWKLQMGSCPSLFCNLRAVDLQRPSVKL